MDEGNRSYWLPEKEPVLQISSKLKKTIRSDVQVEEGDRGGIQYVSRTSPLDIYLKLGFITKGQHRAGVRLLRLWQKGYGNPYVQVKYSDLGGVSATEFFPLGMEALDYRSAIGTVRGEVERRTLHAVCCEGIAASQAMAYSSPRTAKRMGMLRLKSGLDDLISYFDK